MVRHMNLYTYKGLSLGLWSLFYGSRTLKQPYLTLVENVKKHNFK